MRSHAERARNSALKIEGAIPYAAPNPRDTVSRARPLLSAQAPISVEASLAKSASKTSGQSFFCPGEGEHFSRRARFSRCVASVTSFSAVRASSSTLSK